MFKLHPGLNLLKLINLHIETNFLAKTDETSEQLSQKLSRKISILFKLPEHFH